MGVPVVEWPPVLFVLRGAQAGRPPQPGDILEVLDAATSPDAFADGEDLIVANALLSTVLLVSSTCDIEHREKILVVPVLPIDVIDNAARAEATRQDKVYHRFFMPGFRSTGPHGDVVLPDSFAELALLNSVPRDRIPLALRINSLTERARNLLKAKLTTFLARPEPAE